MKTRKMWQNHQGLEPKNHKSRWKKKGKEDLASIETAVLDDPVKFTRLCWPDIRLYDKQVEILESVRDNVETFCHAANEMGKDFTAAICIIWFFCSRTPARVVTSSSGETQLKSILWSEIQHRVETSRVDLNLQMGSLSIKKLRKDGTVDKLSYVIGHVTKTVENFHGHHLPHDKPRVLAVFDEASGIADEYYTAAESWYHRVLAIGNPMNTINFFFRNCKQGDVEDPAGVAKLQRHVIHIDGDDSPNVKIIRELDRLGKKPKPPYPTIIPGVLAYDEYVRRELKWDKIKRQIRLHGHFYEGSESLLCPPDWLDNAEKFYRSLHPEGYEKSQRVRAPEAMGVDTGAGRDLSFWTLIDRIGLIYQYGLPTPDTNRITEITIEMMREFKVPENRICFDAGGGGKQIVDNLRSKGYKRIRSVSFGGAPTPAADKKSKSRLAKIEVSEDRVVYKNKRAEMYGLIRSWIDPFANEMPFALPEELFMLRQELAIMPMWYDEEGRMYLPPKDRAPSKKENPDDITIKKLLGRSPDRADSLVLACYALEKTGAIVVGAF